MSEPKEIWIGERRSHPTIKGEYDICSIRDGNLIGPSGWNKYIKKSAYDVLKPYEEHIFSYAHKELTDDYLGKHIAQALIEDHRKLKTENARLEREIDITRGQCVLVTKDTEKHKDTFINNILELERLRIKNRKLTDHIDSLKEVLELTEVAKGEG